MEHSRRQKSDRHGRFWHHHGPNAIALSALVWFDYGTLKSASPKATRSAPVVVVPPSVPHLASAKSGHLTRSVGVLDFQCPRLRVPGWLAHCGGSDVTKWRRSVPVSRRMSCWTAQGPGTAVRRTVDKGGPCLPRSPQIDDSKLLPPRLHVVAHRVVAHRVVAHRVGRPVHCFAPKFTPPTTFSSRSACA